MYKSYIASPLSRMELILAYVSGTLRRPMNSFKSRLFLIAAVLLAPLLATAETATPHLSQRRSPRAMGRQHRLP